LIRRQSVSVMLSVATGTYFLAASLVAGWTGIPWVVIVHDDWVPLVSDISRLPQGIFRYIMGRVLRKATHIFVVSAGMQDLLQSRYGVQSEIQMPATEPCALPSPPELKKRDGVFRILYMGNGVAAQDSLTLLMDVIREGGLRKYGLENAELHLCTPYRVDGPGIRNHGWVTETGARERIADADLLFLPYGFTPGDRAVALTSFPAKSADYFASGKPVLVMGPKDSSIVRHAEAYRCAAVVTEPDRDALAGAIARVALDGAYRRHITQNAHRAFEENQNIFRQRERLFEVARTLAAGRRKENPVGGGR
jgi:glycosyltransferase involved in cell wall biosynthesis